MEAPASDAKQQHEFESRECEMPEAVENVEARITDQEGRHANDSKSAATENLERPTDEQILQQQNTIRADVAHLHPYVGQKETLDSLKAEYACGNDVFIRKVENLENKYSHVRRTRGDGNCFFRAFLFSYMEYLLTNVDKQECNRFITCIQSWRKKLAEVGFQELVFEDAMDLLLQQVNGILHGNIGLEALVGAFQDDMISNMMVLLMRLITSAEVQRREDFFLPFILGMYDDPPPTVEAFCQRYVEPMAEESDNIHIVALTDALQVPVTVVHLDRSTMAGAAEAAEATELSANTHPFVPNGMEDHVGPVPHVLYRPGHYDILYPRC